MNHIPHNTPHYSGGIALVGTAGFLPKPGNPALGANLGQVNHAGNALAEMGDSRSPVAAIKKAAENKGMRFDITKRVEPGGMEEGGTA